MITVVTLKRVNKNINHLIYLLELFKIAPADRY